jgi:hypothetical protein
LNDRVHLFVPEPTVRFRAGASLAGGFGNAPSGTGENPPEGVPIRFYLKDAPSGPVTLKILSERNGATEEVRKFDLSAASGGASGRGGRGGGGRRGGRQVELRVAQGANTFIWDFRYSPPNVLPDAVFQGQAVGPLAPPGAYHVELTVAGQTYSQPFKVLKDPRVTYSDTDLDEQFQFMKRVSERLEQTMTTVKRIRAMRKRAEDMAAQSRKDGRNAAGTRCGGQGTER